MKDGSKNKIDLIGGVLPLVGCTIALVLINLTTIYDLDFGFHLATGRHLLSQGIPQTEFFVPLLGDQPYSSLFFLSDMIITLLWSVMGPASLVLLKILGYGGGFFLVGLVAIRRGVPIWLATTLTVLMACSISTRFVERPGFFSVLLLGCLFLFADSFILSDKRRPSWWLPVVSGVFFALWSFLHAEFYLGLFILGTFLLARIVRYSEWKSPRTICLSASVLMVSFCLPLVLFVCIHPDSYRAFLAPLSVAQDAKAMIPLREYSVAAWKLQFPAIPFLLMAGACVIRCFQLKRWPEALMLITLLLLTVKVPRAALPAVLVSVPYVCEWVNAVLVKGRMVQKGWLIAIVLPFVSLLSIYLHPSRQLGYSLDPTLDTRGVGDVLGLVGEKEGPVLARFGLASLLLSNRSVVRQGVVMEGRTEAYTEDYFQQVYLPCFSPEADGWKEHLEKHRIVFYFEPFIPENPMAAEFEEIGWELIGWDNSGRLYGRPDIVKKYDLPVYQVDPARLAQLAQASQQEIQQAEREVYGRVIDLELQGLVVQHGWVAHARLAIAAGDLQQADQSLLQARRQGANRLSSYHQTLEMLSKMK